MKESASVNEVPSIRIFPGTIQNPPPDMRIFYLTRPVLGPLENIRVWDSGLSNNRL